MPPSPVLSDMAPSSTLSDAIFCLPRSLASHRGRHPAWCASATGLLHAFRSRIMGDGYRPELHYMRGGRTPGARSLARA